MNEPAGNHRVLELETDATLSMRQKKRPGRIDLLMAEPWENVMVEIKGVAHFAIPVSDMDRSKRFYTEIVGCKYLSMTPDKSICFLDASGVCVLLIKHDPPILTKLEGSNGVHHAFMVDASSYHAALDHLRANGVEIFFEEDRQGGTINGPRAYFRDPDGTALEYINRTSYAGAK